MNKADSQATARTAGSFYMQETESSTAVLSTPPLSPTVVRALNALNIHTLADVEALGAAHCFALLKASGLTITKSTLWQLGALVCHTTAQQLSPEQKQMLQAAYQALPPVHLPPHVEEQHSYMQAALEQAQAAALQGEIPIGAVVVYQGQIIARAHNECVQQHFIGAHAEMLALQRAGAVLQSYRLSECDVYVTVEPCMMCAGALLQARVKRVIYGIAEAKTGAIESQLQIATHNHLNQHTAFFSGTNAEECRHLMQDFFKSKR